MIERGVPWGGPVSGPPDLEVAGDDAALGAAIAGHRDARVAFVPGPGSDLARAVGLASGGGETRDAVGSAAGTRAAEVELPMDVLRCGELLAVNMIVTGAPPDRVRWWHRRRRCRVTVDGRAWFAGRAFGVVVATGQFLRGYDVVPRGHPGDGRAEVQVYTVPPRLRAALRARLPQGAHLPHPGIAQASGRVVGVEWPGPMPLEMDGHPVSSRARLVVELDHAAYRLLV